MKNILNQAQELLLGISDLFKILGFYFKGHAHGHEKKAESLDYIIDWNTLIAIYIQEPKDLFWEIKKARIRYYQKNSKKGKNYLIPEGWLKRITCFAA